MNRMDRRSREYPGAEKPKYCRNSSEWLVRNLHEDVEASLAVNGSQ
jgi:hypothetical protein